MASTSVSGTSPSTSSCDTESGEPTVVDLILHSGRVRDYESATVHEAIAVANGRVVAVGTNEDVTALATSKSRVVDLVGAVVAPGFIDAHGHLLSAVDVARWADLRGEPAGPRRSIHELAPAMAAHAARRATPPGEWVVGYGYDASAYEEGREATRDDLDALVPDHPAMMIHVSQHGAVLNSRALALAGLSALTPTPPGSTVVRRGDNEPDGLVMENAFFALFRRLEPPSVSEWREDLRTSLAMYAAAGVTTVSEGATSASGYASLRDAARDGALALDVAAEATWVDVDAVLDAGVPIGVAEGHLTLRGAKVIIDGSPQAKTAWWRDPIETPGPSGEAEWRGGPIADPEYLLAEMSRLRTRGLQLFAHANGDAAIDLVIEWARREGLNPSMDHRTVVVHSQFMRDDQLDAFAQLGLTPSFFTNHTFFWGDVHVANTGVARASMTSPLAAALARGVICSNHCDYPITPMSPTRMVHSAVSRLSRSGAVIGPDQRAGRLEALRAITSAAAFQIREDADKGHLGIGARADLVVLDRDLATCDVDEILGARVLATVKDGVVVHAASDSPLETKDR
jgi:hypothetical protein